MTQKTIHSKKLRVGIMLDQYNMEAWEYKMLEYIIHSDHASIELIIINVHKKQSATRKLPVLTLETDGWLSRTLISMDNFFARHLSSSPDAFAYMDGTQLLHSIPEISIQPKTNQNYDYFDQSDLQKINNFNLDVIIQLGFRDLTGEILQAAQYGIWRYQHADTTMIRGGPPGFWETLEQMDERGVVIQLVQDDQDDEIILYRSLFPCIPYSIKINNNYCFFRSAIFIARLLKRISLEGEEGFLNMINEQNARSHSVNGKTTYNKPNNADFIKMLIKQPYRLIRTHLHTRLFHRQWLLMYDFHDEISTSFDQYKTIIPPKDRFWADPHILYQDDMYYIYLEEYQYAKKKGYISLIEMQPSGEYSDPVKVLEEPFHLSYPHIFYHDETLFMIPETKEANSINLYECTRFPYEWKHRTTLMDSVEAVDATVLYHENTWWLFTNIADPKGTTDLNELYLFHSDTLLNDDWSPHPKNPIVSDIKKARPAGNIVTLDDILIRPAQICVPRYGYGISLNEIVVLTEEDYYEKENSIIEPTWDTRLNGVHTFCRENKLTMIDGDYNRFRYRIGNLCQSRFSFPRRIGRKCRHLPPFQVG